MDIIMPKDQIISAYVRARELAPTHAAACSAVAQTTGLEEETGRAVVDEHLALSHGELA